MLKYVKSCYWKVYLLVKLQAFHVELYRKINSNPSIFQLTFLLFMSTCFKENSKEKSNNFEMQCILCYSRCIALHFQLFQLVHLTDQGPTFHETRMNRMIGQHLLSSAINKKERVTWKLHCFVCLFVCLFV